MSSERFIPNEVSTMVCDVVGCGHVRWRHVFHPAIRGCTVKGCGCGANGAFERATGPAITEMVTDLKTGKKLAIAQPAPPAPGSV